MRVPVRKTRTGSRSTLPPERDHVEIADAFAREAIADTEGRRHGHWVRLAASRYLKDRARAAEKNGPFVFSPEKAKDACEFIEKLPHVEGRWDSPYVVMHASHVFFVVNLFGFRLPDGLRRFTSALLCIGRKNAKSWLAAAILIYCQCCEDEPGAQIMSAATTGDQARKIFNPAKAIVDKTPDLREQFGLESFANAIVNWNAGSNFKPINAKASTQDGLNPSHVGLDEIHAHKNHDLLNVLRSASGARRHTLWLYMTTEGYSNAGPWPDLRHYARQVLSGLFEADHFLFLIFAMDEQVGEQGQPGYRPGDDAFDESKWPKSNPLIEVSQPLLIAIRKHAAEAKQMPGQMAEFQIKRCNRQAAGATAWLNIERWKRCAGPVDLTFLEGKDCWGGLDGASTTDLMAFRLVWRVGDVVYTWGRRWVPIDAVSQRTARGTVPYASWVAAGLISQLPGNVLDYDIIEQEILELVLRFKPKVVGYDPWNLRDLMNRLKKKGPTRETEDHKTVSIFEEFRQGPKSYHPAMTESERLYLAGNLRHGSDAVLNWCMSNVVPRRDVNLNMAPDRQRSADKIDDACAFYMGVGVMGAPSSADKKFQLIVV